MTEGAAAEARSRSDRAYRRLEALYDPFDPARPTQPPRGLAAFFRWAYADLGPILALLVLCSAAIGLTEAAIIDGVGRLVDLAAASGPEEFWADHAGFLVFLGVLVLVLRPLAVIAQGALGSLVVAPGVGCGLIWRLHRHLLGHSLRFFEDDFAGRLAQKEMQASTAAVSIVIDVVNSVGLILSFLLGMIVALGLADWRLGLAATVWAAAYLLALRALLPEIRAASKERAERRAAATGQLVDSVSNIKTVKLFAEPGQEEAAAEASLRRYLAAAFGFGRAVTRLRVALALLNGAALAAMLALALLLWTSGAVSIGAAAAAGMLTLRVTAMSNWIAFTALGIFSEVGTLEDALGTFARPREVVDPPAPQRPPAGALGARIVFEAVSFDYGRTTDDTLGGEPAGPLRRIAALREVSLAIEPGERVGLVGPSGAGKSTLVALLARLYDVRSGRVTLGGIDVRDMAQAELRARIGVVTQEAALFNRSALDNIRYGRPRATEAEAVAAAARAFADGFIRPLRDIRGREGYAAHLGERGVKLSGGQRQRIALARAFLKDAPILVLDEATSALDSEVEAEVLDAMAALMAGRTVLAIAHRLSTLAAMDRLVVLDQGRIVERGRHAELLAAGGLYARLWSRQSGGFIGAAA